MANDLSCPLPLELEVEAVLTLCRLPLPVQLQRRRVWACLPPSSRPVVVAPPPLLAAASSPDVELGTSTAPERRPCSIQCLQGRAATEIDASVPCLRGIHYRPFSSFL